MPLNIPMVGVRHDYTAGAMNTSGTLEYSRVVPIAWPPLMMGLNRPR